MGIQTRRWMRHFFCARDLFREIVVLAIALQRPLPNKAPTFDGEMFLSDRERITASEFGHLHRLDAIRAGNSNMRIRRRPQEIAIEPGLLCKTKLFLQIAACIWKFDKLRHSAAPTERNRNGIVGVAGGYTRCNDK